MQEQNTTGEPAAASADPQPTALEAPAQGASRPSSKQPPLPLSGHPQPKNLGKLTLGCIGLVYGDAMITPAMLVLSAVEGTVTVAPSFTLYAVPVTLRIIIGLVLFQAQITKRAAILFGPIMVVWFLTMFALV